MNTILRALKRAALLCTFLFLPAMSFGGFFISNGQLVDDNGVPFVMRGVAYPYTWYSWRGAATVQQDLTNIAATRANTVRYVLSTGGQWARIPGSEVTSVIEWAKQRNMISVLEVHDSTGWSEGAGSVHITNAVQYWTSADIRAAINGQEDFAIINIANEPFGNNTTANFVNDTIAAIQAIRAAGVTHTLMIDAPNWGQDWSNTMRTPANAMALWNADPLRNLVFSVHMYEVYAQATTISSYMQAFDDMGLPLVIGEFGLQHNGQDVDEATIMAQAQQRGNGYIAWSWSGNGGCCTFLDMVTDFGTTLTQWGQIVVNGPNGIFATSVPATVFPGGGNNLTVSPTAVTFGSGASTAPVTVTSNVSWTVTDNQTWLSVAPTSGTNNGSFTISATLNNSATSRSGVVTVSGGGIQRQITVNQAGQPNDPFLNAAPTSLSFNAAASSAPITITSNVNWTAVDNQTWITVSPGTGANNGTVTVSVTANTGTASRVGTVTVSNNTGLTQQVSVTQAGTANFLNVTPTSISLGSAMSTAAITISSNVSWTINDNQPWLTATGSGTGSGNFTVTATANTGAASRNATITVTGGGITRTIPVTQSGQVANSLTISPTSLALAATASSGTVSVTANVSWTVTDDQTWLSTSATSGSGNGSFTVSATANTGSASRSGVVSVTGGGLPARTVTVTQAGTGGTGGTCANPITFTGNTNNFNTTGAACYRTNQTINGWGCYNFDGRTLTVGGEARTCGQMPLTRSADGYYYFSATAGQFAWAGIYAW